MAEWLIAPVLKTGIVRNKELSRVRIPLSPFFLLTRSLSFFYILYRFFPFSIIKRMARLSGIAEPEKKRIYILELDKNELKIKEKERLFKYDLTHPT